MKLRLRSALITFTFSGWFTGLIPTTSAQNLLSQFPLRKQTQYFDFHYNRDSSRLANIMRFDDAFIALVNRNFFKADFDYPIRAVVLENENRFGEFEHYQLH